MATAGDRVSGSQVEFEVMAGVRNYSIYGVVLNVEAVPFEPSDTGYGDPVTLTVRGPLDQVNWPESPMFLGGGTLSCGALTR